MRAKRPTPEHLVFRNGAPKPANGFAWPAWAVFAVAAVVILGAWYLGSGHREAAGYSGTVISVGHDEDFFNSRRRYEYIIVEEAPGVQKKHYVGRWDTSLIGPGCYVTKAPGTDSRLRCPEHEELMRKARPYLDAQKR